MVGSFIALFPVSYAFIIAGILIAYEIWTAFRNIKQTVLYCLFLTAALFGLYHVVPKPMTPDEMADAIAVRLVALQKPIPPGPPTNLTIGLIGSRDDAIAKRVAEILRDRGFVTK